MNESKSTGSEVSGHTREEMNAALFAQLVMQQANMAMMFLGKMPNPETGEKVHDIESARFFIDQLEMLETKTKGNLSREEESLLKQSLMSVRFAFVETVESPVKKEADIKPDAAAPQPAAHSEVSGKKFTKKY
jgi:hypothetical protein